MHIHSGLVFGATTFGFVLLFGTLWRILAGWLSQTSAGKAMAFMY